VPTPLLLAWSGGKDSLMALDRSPADPEWAARGLLATLDRAGDRVAMHDVRGDLLREQVDALGFPLIEMAIESSASNVAYESALGSALDEARTRIPGLDHIAFVDLFLAELRAWREASLDRIGWNTVFPLWHTPTRELADAFIAPGHRALVTTVDLEQLDGGHCGREFDASFLADLPASIDPCGESGEFHTFCYNSPLFDRPLVLEHREMTTRSGRFRCIDLRLRRPGAGTARTITASVQEHATYIGSLQSSDACDHVEAHREHFSLHAPPGAVHLFIARWPGHFGPLCRSCAHRALRRHRLRSSGTCALHRIALEPWQRRRQYARDPFQVSRWQGIRAQARGRCGRGAGAAVRAR